MKGFGRNVKLLLGRGHRIQIMVYLSFFLVLAFLAILDTEALPQMVEMVATFLLLVMFGMVLIIMGMGECEYAMMVYFGSSRRPAAWAMLLSQYIFLLEQSIILFVVATLVENNECMKAVRFCPLGIIAIVLALTGIGHFINAMSFSGHKLCAGILAFILLGSPMVVLVIFSTALEVNAEMFIPYNNIGVLLVGLAVAVIGAVAYFKTVTKVDLKLA